MQFHLYLDWIKSKSHILTVNTIIVLICSIAVAFYRIKNYGFGAIFDNILRTQSFGEPGSAKASTLQ